MFDEVGVQLAQPRVKAIYVQLSHFVFEDASIRGVFFFAALSTLSAIKKFAE